MEATTACDQSVGETWAPEDITDAYEIGETLGTGHFSKVKLGTDKKTGMKVAIKVSSLANCACSSRWWRAESAHEPSSRDGSTLCIVVGATARHQEATQAHPCWGWPPAAKAGSAHGVTLPAASQCPAAPRTNFPPLSTHPAFFRCTHTLLQPLRPLPRRFQIIQKPPESKMGMLKAEVDILTKSDHPNMCAASHPP